MSLRGKSLELIFPISIIKACAQLTTDAEFEVNGFYAKDQSFAAKIKGSCKEELIHLLIQGSDDLLCQSLTSDLQCRFTSFEFTFPSNDAESQPEISLQGQPKSKRKRGRPRKLHTKPVVKISTDRRTRRQSKILNNGVKIEPMVQKDVAIQQKEELQEGEEKVEERMDEKQEEDYDAADEGVIEEGAVDSHSDDDTMDATSCIAGDPDEVDFDVLHNPVQCNICAEHLTDAAAIQEHVTSRHNVDWSEYCNINDILEDTGNHSVNSPHSDEGQVKTNTYYASHTLARWRKNHRCGNNVRVYTRRKNNEQHTVAQKNQCSYCNQVFGHKRTLNVHIRDTHTKDIIVADMPMVGGDPDSVITTDRSQEYRELVEKSADVALTMGILNTTEDCTACLVCDKVFIGKWAIRTRLPRHIETQHHVSIEKYWKILAADTDSTRTQIIQEISALEWSRKQEKRSQLLGDNAQFHCVGCNRDYCAFNNLMKHIRTQHQNETNFKAILLNAEEQGSAAYRPGMKCREQMNMACPYCGVNRTGRYLIKHLKNIHADEDLINEVLQKAEEEHSNRITEREKERKRKGQQMRHEDRMFDCQYCGQMFHHRQARYRHSRFQCSKNENKKKKIWCRCGKGFLSPESLVKHKIKCDKRERTYQCHLCGKIYTTTSGLYVHKQTRHADNIKVKYTRACEICGKVFYRKQHYLRHMPRHSEERACQCELCGKKFKSAEDIRKHQYAVHYNKYTYHCPDCGHGMNKLSYLKNHKCGRVRRMQDIKAESLNTESCKAEPCEENIVIVSDIKEVPIRHDISVVHADPVTFSHSGTNLRGDAGVSGMINSSHHVDVALDGLVMPPGCEIQVETSGGEGRTFVGSIEGRSVEEMASLERMRMLTGAPSYVIPSHNGRGQVMLVPSSVISETPSLTTLAPSAPQVVAGCYALPQPYQLAPNPYT